MNAWDEILLQIESDKELQRLEDEARQIETAIGCTLDELPEETTAETPADVLLLEVCRLAPRKTVRP